MNPKDEAQPKLGATGIVAAALPMVPRDRWHPALLADPLGPRPAQAGSGKE